MLRLCVGPARLSLVREVRSLFLSVCVCDALSGCSASLGLLSVSLRVCEYIVVISLARALCVCVCTCMCRWLSRSLSLGRRPVSLSIPSPALSLSLCVYMFVCMRVCMYMCVVYTWVWVCVCISVRGWMISCFGVLSECERTGVQLPEPTLMYM